MTRPTTPFLPTRPFSCLWAGEPGEPVVLTMTELALFLEGSRLAGRIPLSPAPVLAAPLDMGAKVECWTKPLRGGEPRRRSLPSSSSAISATPPGA